MARKNKIDFNQLTPKQLIEGINLSIDNADSLFRIATSSKKFGNFGLAKALFILSCEEAIKGFALYNFFLINDDRDINPIFRNHNEKLTILKEGYRSISSDTQAMVKSFDRAREEIPDGNNDQIEKRAKELYYKNMDDIFSSYTEEDIIKDRIWWDQADQNKQNGFYVNFANDQWDYPLNTCREEMMEAATRALNILNHMIGYKNPDEAKYKSKTVD